MFICNDCLKNKFTNSPSIGRYRAVCEGCGQVKDCSDLHSSFLVRKAVTPSPSLWERDDVQFARLLAEIKAVGLTAEQLEGLKSSMHLPTEKVIELLDRAEETWDGLKTQLDYVDEHCTACNSPLLKGAKPNG
jgi:hypothetical protein